MSKSDQARARELRLAEKLRENLRRRKAQLKARGEGGSGNPPGGGTADGAAAAPGTDDTDDA